MLFIVLKNLFFTIAISAIFGTGSINGVVEDDLGNPVAGATVELVGTTCGSVQTDAHGAYTFTGITTGTYTAEACKSGYTCNDRFEIVVTDGQSTDAGIIVIEDISGL